MINIKFTDFNSCLKLLIFINKIEILIECYFESGITNMKISQISKFISLTLAFIIIGFGLSISYSLKHLNQSFASVEFFGTQKDKIFTQITQPIFSYLLNGDATTLSDIEHQLTQIKTDIEGSRDLSDTLQGPFVALINEIQQTALFEVMAAGKLADPQELLINNERQMSGHLRTLLQYVKEAQHVKPPIELKYLKVISQSEAALINLMKVRQSFFSARKHISPELVNQQLQELASSASELKKLPLLGVMKESSHGSNAFQLGEKTEKLPKEDKAIEPINEISSLVQRYNKDLSIAQKVAGDKLNSQEKVKQQIVNLQQKLMVLEKAITDEYQYYERLMYIVMGVCSLLIVMALLSSFFVGKKILRKISALESTMSKIAQTGDLAIRATISHNDEIDSMARSFNLMVEKLQETSKLVKQKINDIQTMLQNMPQGLLSFDDQNKVNSEYSAYLEKILETDCIAGNDVIKLFFEDSNLGSDVIAQLSAISGACVGEDAMNFGFNEHLLINEIEKEMPNGSRKILDLNWAPVINEHDVVEQILLCVRDVTELRKLAAEAAKQKRDLEIIGEILAVNQEKFHEFITSSITYIDEIENMIRSNPNGGADAINAMFRNMHTIKGHARTYDLKNLTNLLHDTESIYAELRQPIPTLSWDQARLLDELAQVRQLVEYYANTNEVSLGRKGPGRRGNVEKYLMVDKKQIQETIKLLEKVSHTNIYDLIEAKNLVHRTLRLLGTEKLEVTFAPIIASLNELAQSLGKEEPEVSINSGNLVVKIQSVGVIKDIFTHLFRNCVDHGLELPEERLNHAKPAKGQIKVAMVTEPEHLKISIRDDGRGLALAKIRQQAMSKGLIQDAQMPNDEKIAALIFLPGFSTADKLTDISGRGVGMDAVLNFARKEGGIVKINFLDGKEGADYRSFEVALYLPLDYAVKIEDPVFEYA